MKRKRSIRIAVSILLAAIIAMPALPVWGCAHQYMAGLGHEALGNRVATVAMLSYDNCSGTTNCIECHDPLQNGLTLLEESHAAGYAFCFRPTDQGKTAELMNRLCEDGVGCNPKVSRQGRKIVLVMSGEGHVRD